MDSSDMLDEVVVLTVVFVGTEELLDKLMIWWLCLGVTVGMFDTALGVSFVGSKLLGSVPGCS